MKSDARAIAQDYFKIHRLYVSGGFHGDDGNATGFARMQHRDNAP